MITGAVARLGGASMSMGVEMTRMLGQDRYSTPAHATAASHPVEGETAPREHGVRGA